MLKIQDTIASDTASELSLRKIKMLEEKLRVSEQRFEALVQGSLQGVLVARNMEILFANEECATMLGYDDVAEMHGAGSLADHLHPDERARLRAYATARLQGLYAPDTYDVRVIRKDGNVRWLEVRLTMVEWDGSPAVQAVCYDITERRRAATELRASEQRFRNLVEGSIQGLLVHAGPSPKFANQAFADMLGYDSPEEVLALESVDDLIHPDDVKRILAIREVRLRGEDAPDVIELQAIRKDGSVMWVELRPTIVQWNGETAFHSAVVDISERKRAVDALRHARDELEVKVEERTHELRQEVAERKAAQEQATHANRSKSAFLSSMSHELRTPLNAILGFAQLLRDYSDRPLSGEQETFVKEILGGGQHLLGLVNVLDLSKIESGRLDFALETFDPTDAMRESLRLVRPLADERGIAILVERPIAPGTLVRADPGRLKQVLLNVLSNAVKYNRDNGAVRIDAASTADGMLRLSIGDTGPGIPAARHDEVFQPFSRLGAEASKVEGTGIGLTLSRQLAEIMGGRLDFESTPGEGSTFWTEIPLAGTE
ncbi:MAG: PAS domain S-box protein [Alphaproteobacteria bacterium]|jgi:PAS domain S-box-containing protein|nr:PAS domain S-box protein [Alphaproteobacteria bacterium]